MTAHRSPNNPERVTGMKLIFAIINNDDSHEVSTALTKSGFSATKLASTGGFLMAGNTTFLICTEDKCVDEAINIIRSRSRRRTLSVPAGQGRTDPSAFPSEIAVGGATVFVTDVERFEKL